MLRLNRRGLRRIRLNVNLVVRLLFDWKGRFCVWDWFGFDWCGCCLGVSGVSMSSASG